MYIGDCIKLLASGFTVDEIRKMDKEPQPEPEAKDAPEDKKDPDPEPKQDNNEDKTDYKALYEQSQKDLEKAKADLTAAQAVNRSHAAGTSEDVDLQKKLNDILL